MPPFATIAAENDECITAGDESLFCIAEACKKSVRIDLTLNEVCSVPPTSEMSYDEIQDIWFTRTEFETIRRSVLQSISKLNQGATFDEQSDTTQGLENFTCVGALQRECHKLRLRKAVLGEQHRQRQRGVEDAEQLSRIAAECVRALREDASATGLDEQLLLSELDELQEELLEKESCRLRPALTICCWNYSLAFVKQWL